MCIFDWFLSYRHSTDDQLALFLSTFAALVAFYDRIFNYCELDSGGLRQRHFWRYTAVGWDSVTKVGDYSRWGLPSEYLEVGYARPEVKSGRGRILANPADRKGFISALRRYASQATFEI
jgi:hypothetical protein